MNEMELRSKMIGFLLSYRFTSLIIYGVLLVCAMYEL